MTFEGLRAESIGKACGLFHRGLGLLVPLAITILISTWLAALLDRWIPAFEGSSVVRVVACTGGTLGLVIAVGWLHTKAQKRPGRFCGAVGLVGSLEEIPLDQVCQLLAGSSKTGTLTLDLQGSLAKVFFENGLFVTAEYLNWSGQEAFNAVHGSVSGRFIFQPGGAIPGHPTRLPVTQLLLEAARVSDEASRWESRLPQAAAIEGAEDLEDVPRS